MPGLTFFISTGFIYALAAIAEIGGCFAVWAVLRNEQSPLWAIPAVVLLVLFAGLLTLTPSEYAGRAYAAYGGVYIAASLLWLWLVEGRQPDLWDLTGGLICLVGAGLILFAPRGH